MRTYLTRAALMCLGILGAFSMFYLASWQYEKMQQKRSVQHQLAKPPIILTNTQHAEAFQPVSMRLQLDPARFFTIHLPSSLSHPRFEVIALAKTWDSQHYDLLVDVGQASSLAHAKQLLTRHRKHTIFTGYLAKPAGSLLTKHPTASKHPPIALAYLDTDYLATLGFIVQPYTFYTNASHMATHGLSAKYLQKKTMQHAQYALQFFTFGLLCIGYTYWLIMRRKPHETHI